MKCEACEEGEGGVRSLVRAGPAVVSLSLSLSRIKGREGGATPARVSEGPPHPRPGPRETGQEAREHIGGPIVITFPGEGNGRHGSGVCMGVLGSVSFFSWLVVLGPETRVVFEFCIACMQVRPPRGGPVGRAEVTGRFSESSEFPRIGPSQPACYPRSSPARPKPPSPCAWEGWRCRGVAVTDCVCGVVYMCVCVRCVYVCACMPVCVYMYVRAGGRIQLSGAGWCCCCPRPAQTTTPHIITGQGQHIVCGHCSCPGPPSISRPGPPAARVPAQGSLRDRRGLYFGGGCLIPRADPGLWVCLGRVRGGGWTVFKLFALEVSSVPMYGMYVSMYVCLTFLVAFYF